MPTFATPALVHAVREIEMHVAEAGWDGPVRLFALINTAQAAAQHPEFAAELPDDVRRAAQADPGHLTAIEQELSATPSELEDLLGTLAWPASVDGCALAVERIVVDQAASAQVPADPEEAMAFLLAHPSREDVRVVVGVMRDGEVFSAMRARSHDDPESVVTGTDLVPGLGEALAATFEG